jgi:hypothetical protein
VLTVVFPASIPGTLALLERTFLGRVEILAVYYGGGNSTIVEVSNLELAQELIDKNFALSQPVKPTSSCLAQKTSSS